MLLILPFFAFITLAAAGCTWSGLDREGIIAARSPQVEEVVEQTDENGIEIEGPEEPDTENEPINDRMIGDLVAGATTDVGRSIQNILLRKESAETDATGYKPPLLGTKACKADTCCVWSYVAQLLTVEFTGGSKRCNKHARAAIRLGFHDAGTWSSKLAAAGQDFGGADGSIVLAAAEIKKPDNDGLQDIVKEMKAWQKLFGVGMADLIQFAAVHAVVTCPLGPRLRFFVGRKDSSKPAVDGLLPSARGTADEVISLFEDKTISPHELVALLGAHSTSQQFNFDKSKKSAPQDSTPGVWDVKYYNETVGTAPKDIVRFPADVFLAGDPRMSDEWTKFRQGNGIGQDHWNADYAAAYTRLSLLGVNNINNLTECSKVLPKARPVFAGASKKLVDD